MITAIFLNKHINLGECVVWYFFTVCTKLFKSRMKCNTLAWIMKKKKCLIYFFTKLYLGTGMTFSKEMPKNN